MLGVKIYSVLSVHTALQWRLRTAGCVSHRGKRVVRQYQTLTCNTKVDVSAFHFCLRVKEPNGAVMASFDISDKSQIGRLPLLGEGGGTIFIQAQHTITCQKTPHTHTYMFVCVCIWAGWVVWVSK